MGDTWLIASGKGGAGKSTICAALGMTLARKGQSVAIMDAVCGLRNQDMLLDMADRVVYDLVDVVDKNCDIDQALLNHGKIPGLTLLPASQFQSMNRLNPKDMRKLIGALRVRTDIVLIDSPTGIEKGFTNLVEAADHILLVTTPDDISMRDTERAFQIIEHLKGSRPELIINRIMPELIEAGEMYTPETISMTLDMPLFGIIPYDEAVYRSLLNHEDWTEKRGEAAAAIARMSQRMIGEAASMPIYAPNNKRSFFDRFKRRKGETLL